jgi:outer membrane cobalamin receptor
MAVKKLALFIYIFTLITLRGFSQSLDDSTNYQYIAPSLEELLSIEKQKNLDTKVSISSLVDIDKNEAPGIVTIITSKEIELMGARDLIDVLNTVPGFNLASDVQNGVAFGIRGNWSQEGKMLYMIDGIPMNELAYGSYIVGNRFPINIIDKIEINRGAGSSLYGGLAGLGVVNIITKKGDKINGHKLFVNSGVSNSALSRSGINYTYGGELLNGTEICFSALVNNGNRSNLKETFPDSTDVSFRDSSKVMNQNIYFSIKKNNFQIKHYYEDYNFQSTFEPIYSSAKTLIEELSYNVKINKLSLSPIFRYKWQIPWNSEYGNAQLYNPNNIETRKITLGFNSSYLLTNNIQLSFGSTYYNEAYNYFISSYKKSNKYIGFNGFTFYSEFFIKSKFANGFFGIRFDDYAFFKPFWAPRFTITKNFGNFFYKAIGNVSYKIPTLQNIVQSSNNSILPEVINEAQFQIGFQNQLLEISTIAFLNKINKLIIYSVDSLQIESYQNKGNIVTKGLEIELKLKLEKVIISGNYSFYQPFNGDADDVIIDINNRKLGTFAFPKHKLFFGVNYLLNNNVGLNIYNIYQSSKSFVTRIDQQDNYHMVTKNGTYNLNITCQIKNIYNNHINLNFGLYNVLNTRNYYGYAYKEGYEPMVGMGRELFIQLKYNL